MGCALRLCTPNLRSSPTYPALGISKLLEYGSMSFLGIKRLFDKMGGTVRGVKAFVKENGIYWNRQQVHPVY